MMDEKRALRADVLKRRDALSLAQRQPRCATICAELSEILNEALAIYHNVSADVHVCYHQPPFMLALYHAMKSEVDLASFTEAAYCKNVTICFPCMTKAQDSPEPKSYMAMREVPHAHYENNSVPFLTDPLKSFCVDDPILKEFPLVDASLFDMVVVPVVAFDNENNRIGYGGGNYDRFLNAICDSTLVVGVAFDEQRVAAVPCEPHDLALPQIIVG
ncbi:MAG: 5-formyltetrahydrofolate cyclo-ligase [Raoultibacter sp.]